MAGKLDTSITAKSFKKTFGSKSFLIGAVTNSDGVLSYSSDNIKVVKVSDSGKVKITGCGKTNITITSSETDTYGTATETVTVTVLPGKLKIKKISSPKSSQISFSWSKMQGATEYQYSISGSKSFKKAPKFSGKSTTVKKKASGASGRKFYVRARAITKIDGKKYYGKWSKIKSVIIK